jgi:putative PEP-CTERM system histidine kinase
VVNFLREAFSDGVYVFLPVPGGGRFGLYYPFGHDFTDALPVEGESADWLWRLGEPVFIANWVSRVENQKEKQFLTNIAQSLGGRIAVPLLARRRFLGFAILGPRRGRPDYNDEDFEFLSAMSGPVAFAVLTGQVSVELLARREMDSFNRISTYIVHDLKNSISMLSMLLQNAEKHIADPAFQQSALKTINEAVGNMERLIGKISGGKDRLRSAPRPTELNRTISEIAHRAGLSAHPGLDYRFEPGDIPAAIGDPVQIRRIIENLLINAVEAMNEHGKLEVSTGVQNDSDGLWVWARIRDSGCGMTREFASTRLFKPFETTKKKGLGIGMYQVKEMIEADGGRIQLASEPGKGSTFEVFWRTSRNTARQEKVERPGDGLTAR